MEAVKIRQHLFSVPTSSSSEYHGALFMHGENLVGELSKKIVKAGHWDGRFMRGGGGLNHVFARQRKWIS